MPSSVNVLDYFTALSEELLNKYKNHEIETEVFVQGVDALNKLASSMNVPFTFAPPEYEDSLYDSYGNRTYHGDTYDSYGESYTTDSY